MLSVVEKDMKGSICTAQDQSGEPCLAQWYILQYVHSRLASTLGWGLGTLCYMHIMYLFISAHNFFINLHNTHTHIHSYTHAWTRTCHTHWHMHIWNEFLHFIIIATRKLATDHLEYIMILFCCCRVYSATLGYPQAWERMCQSTHQWTGLKGSCCFQRIRHHCSSCGCIIRYIRCGCGKTSCQLLDCIVVVIL